MARLLATFVLAVFVAQSSGALTLIAEASECEESCPGDSPERGCPPGCHSCACCAGHQSVAPRGAVSLALPPAAPGLVAQVGRSVLEPDPDEILHVPKLLSA